MTTLEIVIAVLATTTAVAGAITAVSEILPFFKKISGNGIAHTIYHIFNREKCSPPPPLSPKIIACEPPC
tara:strand:+ start:3177 stop:3386 length:210 start_codon:yes stop_codon:yes gene_type:complete